MKVLDDIEARVDEALLHQNLDPSVHADMAWNAVADIPKLIAALEAVGELFKRVSQQAVDKYNKARVLPPDERAVAAAAAVEFEVIAADLHQAISEALA